MKIFNAEGEVVNQAKKCQRPRFSHRQGRTWDSTEKRMDGEVVEWWFDSTWGRNMYFVWKGTWYSTPIIRKGNSDSLQYREKLFTHPPEGTE